MSATSLSQRPLRDRQEDSQLFAPPTGYDTGLWTARQGLNALILGTPGQGKTSVLHQLERALRQETHGPPPVFVDLATADSVAVALQHLVAAGSRATGRALSWVPPPTLPNETVEQSATGAWLKQLAELPGCAFLIDNLRPEEVGFPLFGILRDRLWEMPHQWIATADRHTGRRRLLRAPADSFWEQVLDLDYTSNAARELIARRIGDEPQWLGPVVENAGANPRQLLRAALSALRDQQQASGTLKHWEDWHRRVAQLDRRPAMLMAELSARPPVSASDPELLKSLGWARSSLLRTLEQLEREGLVESWSEPDGTGRPKRLFTTTEPGRPRRG
jgi:hypothetical protein